MGDQSLSNESKLWAALCYVIGIIVPLVVLVTDKKNDKYVAFHAYQALISQAILWGVTTVLSAVLIGLLLMPIVLLLMLYWGYKAYMGEMFMVPTVGEMAQRYVNSNK